MNNRLYAIRLTAAVAAAFTLAGIGACESSGKSERVGSAEADHSIVWGKIGPFAIGMLQRTVYTKHGFGSAGLSWPFTDYKVAGGRVDVDFTKGQVSQLRCGTPNGLSQGGGCPRGFALPDGVALGAFVTSRSAWKGYKPDPEHRFWQKTVTSGQRMIRVALGVSLGHRVTDIFQQS